MKKALTIIGLAIIIAGGLFLAVKTVYEAYEERYIPVTSMVDPFDHAETILLVGAERAPKNMNPLLLDGRILLSVDAVRTYIDKNIVWDSKEKKVTITTKDKVIRMETEKLQAHINNNPVRLDIPVTEKDGKVYIPIEFLADFYSIEIRYDKTTDLVIVDYLNRMVQEARVISEKAAIRSGRSIKKEILVNVDYGTSMRVFEEYKDWYKVRLNNGVVGYIQAEDVGVNWVTMIHIPYEPPRDFSWKPKTGKVSLSWHSMYSGTPDMTGVEKVDGLDVMSPRWFEVIDEHGNLKNIGDLNYTRWAHEEGYQVWAMVVNNFADNQETSLLLNSTEARDNLIRQLLAFASLYEIDGINFDFENVLLKDRDMLTQLMREAVPLLKEQGLIVSIDVGVPDGSETYSLCYDHKALGEIMDFVMLMTYDQHWHGSPVAGSVAQYGWVENRLRRTLEMVPNEKLLLGIPFYSRLWEETTTQNGSVSVKTAKTPSIQGMRNIAKANEGSTITWDDVSKQFYLEYYEGDVRYRMWIEDENSLNLKTSLALKYNLAGVCSWDYNCSDQKVWEAIYANLKADISYEDWLLQYADAQFSYIVEKPEEDKPIA
ncbi:MAG TPA: glycoside hydrolase [Clostridiales bacterium]|nr:glycoside hydrolase [Clostridiales bacterium]